MSRPRVEKKERHKARGVSLPPNMEKEALAKSCRLNMSFSKYVQRLIENDLKTNVLARLLMDDAKAA